MMLTSPACAPAAQWLSTKSAERHLRIAPGLPNTPSGRLIVRSLATSGWPGWVRRIVAPRSGCPPAWGSVEVTWNSSITGLAAAGAARTAAAATTAKRAPIACLLILIFSLLIICSAVAGGRVALVAAPFVVAGLDAAPAAQDEALAATLFRFGG